MSGLRSTGWDSQGAAGRNSGQVDCRNRDRNLGMWVSFRNTAPLYIRRRGIADHAIPVHFLRNAVDCFASVRGNVDEEAGGLAIFWLHQLRTLPVPHAFLSFIRLACQQRVATCRERTLSHISAFP